MAFTQKVNPFNGILCVPYYHLFIPIIVSWISIWLQRKFMNLLDKYIDGSLILNYAKVKNDIILQIKQDYVTNLSQLDLDSIYGDSIQIPAEIISNIISFIPIDDNNEPILSYMEQYRNEIRSKRQIALNILYIYPTIRFMANGVCFIIIMYQYALWYNQYSHYSNWRKYCAFVIAWLYMPNFNGKGIIPIAIRKLKHNFTDYIKDPHTNTVTAFYVSIQVTQFQVAVEYLLLIIFCVISLPVSFVGIFLFITTTILAFLFFGIFYLCTQYCLKSLSVGRGYYMAGFALIKLWYVWMTIICTMEFYSRTTWFEAYFIAWNGRYCDEDDYLSVRNWNQYEWHIQFLIICWFLF